MAFLFEQEIEQILATVRAQTIGESENITLRELLVANIHPALKAYFRAEVEKSLQDERAKEQRSKRFPYFLPEVVSLQQQIDVLLVQHYEFTQDDFEKVLDEAVHFQFNYLCRPQWTLLNFVVGDRRRVPVSEVERKLARCVDYRYFPELINRYCIDKGLAEFTYEEFRSLVERIDKEVTSRHTSKELASMTRSLLSFVDFGKASPHDASNRPTLPTNAAIVFFEDKHLEHVKLRLEAERDRDGRITLTLDELADIVAGVWEDPEPQAVQKDELNLAGIPEAVRSLPPEASPVKTESRLAKRPGRPPDSDDGVFAPREAVRPPVEGLDDVFGLFSKNDVRRFVKSIFRKDDRSFRESLDDVNRMSAWDDASHYLDELFLKNNVDPFSREAVEFTDRVYSRFHPKRNG